MNVTGTPERIWVVGASARAAAEALVAAGAIVSAADLFCDVDLVRIASCQQIHHWPRDLRRVEPPPEATSWLYTGGIENHPQVVERLSARLPLLGGGADTLRRVRNIQLLNETVRAVGLRMPATAKVADDSVRWLVKNRRSGGGLHIRWAKPGQASARGSYLQQFIEGRVYGVSYVGHRDGALLLGVAEQLRNCPWTAAPEFAYAGSITADDAARQHGEVFERLGNHLARTFELRGWFGVDVVVDHNGRPWVLEVNPRLPASLEILPIAPSDAARLHIAACRGEPIEPPRSVSPGVAGKAIVYARCDATVTPEITEWLLSDATFHDIPAAGTDLVAGTPIVTIVAQAGRREDLLNTFAVRCRPVHERLGM
jgi:predicted ATP-grasp superfamily ATP-dependent carboligase